MPQAPGNKLKLYFGARWHRPIVARVKPTRNVLGGPLPRYIKPPELHAIQKAHPRPVPHHMTLLVIHRCLKITWFRPELFREVDALNGAICVRIRQPGTPAICLFCGLGPGELTETASYQSWRYSTRL